MNTAGKLSSRRLRSHHYSTPGTYHVLFETEDEREVLGTVRRGVVTIGKYGQVFLAVLGFTLQRFPCVSIKAMDIQPSFVEMVVLLTGWRLKLCVFLERKLAWIHDRRTMVIPLFVGYAKMNSGRRINVMNGVCDQAVWTRRYKAGFLTDESEIAQLCAELDARFQRVRFEKLTEETTEPIVSLASMLTSALGGLACEQSSSVAMVASPEREFDTLLLGRAMFLSGPMLRPLPMDVEMENADAACAGGRTQVPPVCSIGPGKIFLTGLQES